MMRLENVVIMGIMISLLAILAINFPFAVIATAGAPTGVEVNETAETIDIVHSTTLQDQSSGYGIATAFELLDARIDGQLTTPQTLATTSAPGSGGTCPTFSTGSTANGYPGTLCSCGYSDGRKIYVTTNIVESAALRWKVYRFTEPIAGKSTSGSLRIAWASGLGLNSQTNPPYASQQASDACQAVHDGRAMGGSTFPQDFSFGSGTPQSPWVPHTIGEWVWYLQSMVWTWIVWAVGGSLWLAWLLLLLVVLLLWYIYSRRKKKK